MTGTLVCFKKTQKKNFVNLVYDWPILQYQDIAKSLTKGEFAQNSKNRSDIYEHVLIHPYLVLMQMFKLEAKISTRRFTYHEITSPSNLHKH